MPSLNDEISCLLSSVYHILSMPISSHLIVDGWLAGRRETASSDKCDVYDE